MMMSFSGTIRAEGGAHPRIVLASGSSPRLARQIRAEAASLRLTVVDATEDEPDETLLTRYDASAVVRIESADHVTLTVADPSGTLRSSTLERAPGEAEEFSVRVVEQLRAHLIELRVLVPTDAARGADEPRSSPAPTSRPDGASAEPGARADRATAATEAGRGPDRRASENQEPPPAHEGLSHRSPSGDSTARSSAPSGDSADRRALWLFAGLGGIAPNGGLGASGHVAAGMRFETQGPFSVAATALASVSEVGTTAAEGEASGRPHLFGAQMGWEPLSENADWSVELGPGLGLLLLVLEGTGNPPFEGHKDRLVASAPYLHASAAWRVQPWLRMRAALLGGAAVPRPVVRFDERPVAAWGPWFGAATLTAELGVALDGETSR